MGPGRPGGVLGRRMGVVEIPAKALAVMLGLSSEQTDKIEAIQKEGRPQRPPMGRRDGDQGAPSEPGKRMASREDRRKKAKAAIMAVLTDSQKALIPQASDEAVALCAAHVPLPALPDLGLSSDQLKKIAAIGADGHKKAVALLTSDSDDLDGPPQETLRDTEEAMGDDVRALMTSDQRAKVRAARRQFRPGGPMDGPPPPFGRDRGGRRGPGRPGFDSAEEGFDGPPPPMDGGQGGRPRQARGFRGQQGFDGPPMGGPGEPGFDGPPMGGPGFDGPPMGGPGFQEGGPAGPPPPDADVF